MGEFQDFTYQNFKYKLYVPSKYKEDIETPLMVMLHGCGQDPDDFAAGTNMNTLAEQENFLVLYPNMNNLFNPSNPAGYNPFGCWNWFLDKNQHRGKGHPKLIFEIIEEVKSKYSIDSNKVYAAGLSAGGSLACILGVTYPDVFSGIGICSGLAYDAANVFFLTDPLAEDAKKSMEKGVPDPYVCGNSAFEEMGQFKKKMPVIVFHGICDTTVHPINGQQVITQWTQTNFLVEGGKGYADVTPTLVKGDIINGKSYTQHIYCDGSGEPLLELWMIDKMGHTWSGGNPNGSYTDPSGPNASEIIWDFFTKNQRHTNEKLDEKQVETPIEYSTSTLDDSSTEKPVELPVDTPIKPPVKTPGEISGKRFDDSLVITQDKSSTIMLDQSPDKMLDDSLVKASGISTDKTLDKSPVLTLDQPPTDVPKKKFLSNFLSKLTKKKRK
ncbi:PHB depolymerase family esterase [Bacillus sp. EB600]|uniref:extracellular catalytic domain type 1 short-chain-length polyhydroxyalkanoate depolymerase n=1 Tax=Bacillus sp. EB600 TaxID=2806345 RepID=UPI002109B014|nr:PHB depolymerase family esterase [Bacillus sp. EB600]MCQ6279563.1 PHB depolymerase family esterase [Bacillus sp. EB600]